MTERYTAEMGRLIGDPTETLVAERLFQLQRSNADDELITGLVLANVMVTAGDADDLDDAYRLIGTALDAGEVRLIMGVDMWRERPAHHVCAFDLDDVMRFRLRRRERYWHLDAKGHIPPAHIPGECMIARAASVQWHDDYGDAPCGINLIHAVRDVGGLEPYFAPYHVVLNALDAGAIRAEPENGPCDDMAVPRLEDRWLESTARRWFLTDWVER